MSSNCQSDQFYNQYIENIFLIRSIAMITLVIITILKIIFVKKMRNVYYNIDIDFITVDDYTIILKSKNKHITEE